MPLEQLNIIRIHLLTYHNIARQFTIKIPVYVLWLGKLEVYKTICIVGKCSKQETAYQAGSELKL